eukprot:COSAG01_NODE_4663_length_4838_cov_14.590631_2_plen_177_part_00
MPTGSSTDAAKYVVWEYWAGVRELEGSRRLASSSADMVLHVCDEAHPFEIPAPPLSPDPAVITATYHVFAPVLRGGWAFLGELGKLVPASSQRVRSVSVSVSVSGELAAASGGLDACLVGVERESIGVAVMSAAGEVIMTHCTFTATGQLGLHCRDDAAAADRSQPCECQPACASK